MAFHIAISYDIYSDTRQQQSRSTDCCWSNGSDVQSADAFTYRLKSADFL